MTRIAQVKEFNRIMRNQKSYMYVMTNNSGAMHEPERVKGWVIFQNPKLGDSKDFARWFPNRHQAELALEAQT